MAANLLAHHSWNRQDHDTDKSWRAFCIYRDLGPERTYAEAARKYGSNDPKWIAHWAVQHDWRARVVAYDTDADQRQQEKVLAKRWKIAEQDAQIADAFLTRVVQRMRTIDPTTLEMSDLVAMTRLAMSIHQTTYFPKVEAGVQVNTVAQIVIDNAVISPPTLTEPPVRYMDADQ